MGRAVLKYLAPIGGFTDTDFGILASPAMQRGIPSGIEAGLAWAADNGSFTRKFDPDKFLTWLKRYRPYQSTCLFVVCPDVVGDARATLMLFEQYRPRFKGWPLAFVAQDGQEHLDFPDPLSWDCLFVGGSTVWKLGPGAEACILRALALDKHIHIGRVNYKRRYQHFASFDQSERFTCDGTRNRFEGTAKTITAWRSYMALPKQFALSLPGCDCGCQSDHG
jgi:hypothetical protein